IWALGAGDRPPPARRGARPPAGRRLPGGRRVGARAQPPGPRDLRAVGLAAHAGGVDRLPRGPGGLLPAHAVTAVVGGPARPGGASDQVRPTRSTPELRWGLLIRDVPVGSRRGIRGSAGDTRALALAGGPGAAGARRRVRHGRRPLGRLEPPALPRAPLPRLGRVLRRLRRGPAHRRGRPAA